MLRALPDRLSPIKPPLRTYKPIPKNVPLLANDCRKSEIKQETVVRFQPSP